MYSNSEILVNKLFAGSYLNEGENIGHEVINLFRADDDQNYLYITPGGTVDTTVHPISSIIFVRNVEGKTTVEVVAKAEDLSPVDSNSAGDVTYAGAPLSRIFRDNIYHGNAQDLPSTNISFHAKKVRVPKDGTRLIITINPDFTTNDPRAQVIYLNSKSKAIDNQSSRKYYSFASDPEAFCALQKLIDNPNLWEARNTTEKLVTDHTTHYSGPTFLEIIRKENDELVFSNLLAYYFESNPVMFQKFAKDLLDLPGFGRDFKIIRESNHNIDLWIADQNHVLVIENKIKSNLNGIKSDNYSQLNKYQEYTEARVADPDDEVYQHATHYYIFTPDYNPLNTEKYQLEKPYKIIKYSELYRFFERHAAMYLSDRYFTDFLSGLHGHTMSMPDLSLSIMRSRFMEKIQRIR